MKKIEENIHLAHISHSVLVEVVLMEQKLQKCSHHLVQKKCHWVQPVSTSAPSLVSGIKCFNPVSWLHWFSACREMEYQILCRPFYLYMPTIPSQRLNGLCDVITFKRNEYLQGRCLLLLNLLRLDVQG